MRKLFICNAFLLTIISLLLATVCSTIESNKSTIDRIAPSTAELRLKSERMGSSRLTQKEVEKICKNLNMQLIQLERLKRIFTITIVSGILITLAGIYKFDFGPVRFDGLSLILVALLIYGFHWLVYVFSSNFKEGNNASIDIRIGILIGSLIIQPILFYVAFRMTKHEITINLHTQKWISYTAIVLTILSLLVALCLGIGCLFTPDLSSNIT